MKVSQSNLFYILVIIILISGSCAVVERLNAVFCRHDTALSQYLKLKTSRNIWERKSQDLDLSTKNRLCLSIMGSSIYTANGRKPVDEKEINELVREYPETFDKFFKRVDSDSRTGEVLIYSNPTLPILVLNPNGKEPFVENVFSCFSRDADFPYEPDFKEYRISEEYNLSDIPGQYIAARFIFRGSGNEGSYAELNRMAEEPATALLGAIWSNNILSLFMPYVLKHGGASETLHMNIERLYLLKRTKREETFPTPDDRICQLNEDQKYRLCGLVFSSKYFENEITKVPATRLLIAEYGCSRNKVSFRRPDVQREVGKRYFGEKMILCYMAGYSFLYHTEYDKAYYLSLVTNDVPKNSPSSNDVFVYKHGKKDWYGNLNYYLVNLFTNVRL